jgi:ABC-2 type transport system permease protein
MSSPSAAIEPQGGSNGGVIHDIGYRRYTGPRLGRAYAARSLYAHGLRTAYGLGRSAAAKIFPWGVLTLLVGIAAIMVAIQSQLETQFGVEERVVVYWQYPTQINTLVLLFCAVVGPELVSRDIRSGVLPLYFSRPLTRSDYPLAKWAALVSAVFLLLLAPLLVLLFGVAFSQDEAGEVWDEVVLFGEGLVTAGLTSLLFASIALLIASLSGRRAVAAALIVGVFILTTPVLGVLQGIAYSQSNGELTGGALQLSQASFLVSPFTIVQGIGDWLFGEGTPFIGPYGPLYLAVTVGLIVLCLLLTLLRYRRVAR